MTRYRRLERRTARHRGIVERDKMRSIHELRGTNRKLARVLQEILETAYESAPSTMDRAELEASIRDVMAGFERTTGITFDDTFLGQSNDSTAQ